MRPPSVSRFVWLLALTGCGAQQAAAPTGVLPLRTLRLYDTGVGYFERAGALSRSSNMTLPVPAAHLDDALKTLVVLGAGGGVRVEGVAFSSSVGRGMARALAGLPRDTDDPVSYRDLLASLRGADVEVDTDHAVFRGRIVDVVDSKPKTEPADKDAKTVADAIEQGPHVLLFGDDGALRRIHVSELRSVRPLDPSFRARLDAALDALSPRSARAGRALEVLAQSTGPITLGYIAEAPLYRTTYRLVLDDAPGKGGVLQGWALLHNDTDEVWRGVHVELVNGKPDSFLFPLAAPRYARRELVTPDAELSTVPQLFDKTADAIWGDHDGDAYGAGGLGLTGTGEGGGGYGEGIGLGRIGTVGHGAGMTATESSSLLGVGNLASVAEASGEESGALFTYSLAEPLDLRAHASALVPFLQRTIDAREITLVRDATSPARTAVRLVNDTPQTLPPGPISFFAHKGFAGESGLDRLKPGECRFIDYGADLDLQLDERDGTTDEQPKHVTFRAPGTLVEHFLRTSDWTASLENRGGKPKDVYVGLTLDVNATVSGADALDFDLAKSRPMAVYHVAGKTKVEHKMHAVEGLERALQVDSLDASQLAKIASALEPRESALLGEVVKRQKDLEQVRQKLDKARADVKQAEGDLARLREDLKAAGGDSGRAAAPLVTRVLGAEDRLDQLRKQVETLTTDSKTRGEAVLAAARLLPT